MYNVNGLDCYSATEAATYSAEGVSYIAVASDERFKNVCTVQQA